MMDRQDPSWLKVVLYLACAAPLVIGVVCLFLGLLS
jgi:hypothetical protein